MAGQNEIQRGQQNFLMRGGIYEMPLAMLRKAGTLADEYEYHEYPKMLEPRYGSVIVGSFEEEERVKQGGPTTAQEEEEKQSLLAQCRRDGIKADPQWSVGRLRHQMGIELDSTEPRDEMSALKEKLSLLQQKAEMKAKIAALELQLSEKPEDADAMRAELAALGIKADGRWSTARLRDELDRATAPAEGD